MSRHSPYALEVPAELLVYSPAMDYFFLPEEIGDWLESNCRDWQFLGTQSILFDREKDRLYFKMRWL